MILNSPTGSIENYLSDKKLSIYPNPASDKISIKADGPEIEEIKIYNISGVEIMACRNLQAINVSELPIGIYLVKIVAGKEVVNKKFVKE